MERAKIERALSKSFEGSIIWRKAHEFVLSVYLYSDYFPEKEVYSLTSQLRRTAVSIPILIAEGLRKESADERAHFIDIARAAIEECRYYLILAGDLGYGDSQQQMVQLAEVSRLLENERDDGGALPPIASVS